MEPIGVPHYAIATCLGGIIGICEILSRYRDAPRKALVTTTAGFYVFVNAVASLVAIALIDSFAITFGVSTDRPETVRLVQVLVAGLGSMVFLRSSLLTLRVGENDVGIGPSGILQILLSAADRGVDRDRAKSRSETVAKIMKDVSFVKARETLPTYCFALMQNLSAEEQQMFGRQIAALASSGMDDTIKAMVLGLTIMNIVGEDVLRVAVDALGEKIR